MNKYFPIKVIIITAGPPTYQKLLPFCISTQVLYISADKLNSCTSILSLRCSLLDSYCSFKMRLTSWQLDSSFLTSSQIMAYSAGVQPLMSFAVGSQPSSSSLFTILAYCKFTWYLVKQVTYLFKLLTVPNLAAM